MQDQDRLAVFLSYLGFLILVPPFLAYVFFSKMQTHNVYLTLFFLTLTAAFGAFPFISYFFVARTPYSRFHAQQGVFLTFAFLAGTTLLVASRWLALSLSWDTQWLYIAFFAWIFIYISFNIIAATSGFLGRKWQVPVLQRFLVNET